MILVACGRLRSLTYKFYHVMPVAMIRFTLHGMVKKHISKPSIDCVQTAGTSEIPCNASLSEKTINLLVLLRGAFFTCTHNHDKRTKLYSGKKQNDLWLGLNQVFFRHLKLLKLAAQMTSFSHVNMNGRKSMQYFDPQFHRWLPCIILMIKYCRLARGVPLCAGINVNYADADPIQRGSDS